MAEAEVKTVRVEYVGLKPQETDCVAGTGLTWVGVGSVHDVPIKAWAVMAKHTDVWKLVEDAAPTVEPTASAGPSLADARTTAETQAEPPFTRARTEAVVLQDEVTLEELTDQQVRQIAAQRGWTIDGRLRGETLRAKFLELQGA